MKHEETKSKNKTKKKKEFQTLQQNHGAREKVQAWGWEERHWWVVFNNSHLNVGKGNPVYPSKTHWQG